MVIAAPSDQVYALLDRVLGECERHRNLLFLLFVTLIIVGAVASPNRFIVRAVTASATISGTGGALGYISKWRGWSQ